MNVKCRNSRLWAAAVSVLSLLSTASAPTTAYGAPRENVKLQGIVVDQSGKPVGDAVVKAMQEGVSTAVITDSTGRFSVPVKPGDYELSVQAFGYGLALQSVKTGSEQDSKVVLEPAWDPTQPSTAEYLTGLPENAETRYLRAMCLGCHTWYPIVQARGMKAAEWDELLQRMGTGDGLALNMTKLRRDYTTGLLEKYFGPNAPELKQEQVKVVPKDPAVAKALYFEYDLPSYTKFVHSIVGDNKGGAWFTGYDYQSNYLARIDLQTGKIKQYPLEIKDSAPHTPIVDKKGRVWITLADGNALATIDPAVEDKVHYYRIPAEEWQWDPNRTFRLHTPAMDPEMKTLWFSAMATNVLVKFDVSTQKFVKYPIPNPGVPAESAVTWAALPKELNAPDDRRDRNTDEVPLAVRDKDLVSSAESGSGWGADTGFLASSYHVEVDSKGKVWYTQLWLGQVNSYDPKTGRHTTYKTPGVVSSRGLAIDAKDNIWYSNWDGHTIVKLDQRTGKTVQYQPPTKYAAPYGIVFDAKGDLWFADYSGNNITKFDPKTEKFIEYPIPTGAAMPRFISVDDSGRVWFGEWWQSKIGYFLPDGATRKSAAATE